MRSRRVVNLMLLAASLVMVTLVFAEPPSKSEPLWSMEPVATIAPPIVKQGDWPRNPIDQFVLAKLEAAGLSPAPEADRATLIRRLTFDLHGLPPTPAEVDAFVRDERPNAYESLVDRLLDSPRYGERWARHWLDCVRYSESQGFERDKLRPNGWHYRDYVIRAFNEDKPYDRFILEQIAGDALDNATSDSIIATSMLVCGSYDEVGAGQQSAVMRARVREEELEDLISVVSQTFLGLTVNCARCHDHKFAPIPQEDYYRIKSVFDGVYHGERSVSSPAEIQERQARIDALQKEIDPLQRELFAIDDAARHAVLTAREGKNDIAVGPAPTARWTFDDGSPRDTIGALHGELKGGAHIEGGRLILDGEDDYLRTAPLAKDIRAKTLEAWVYLPTLDQGGGGVISIESSNGHTFDSIVFAERQARKWIAGSTGFMRTSDLNAATEAAGPSDVVHMAIVYGDDDSISLYRNGEPYAPPYKKDKLQTYRAGDAHILMGMRHMGGGRAMLRAQIDSASLYDRALTSDEVLASFKASGRYVTQEELLAATPADKRARREELLTAIGRKQQEIKAIPSPTQTVSYVGTRRQPAPTHLLERGDVTKEGAVVTPGALSTIHELPADFGLAADAPEAARRLKLGQWITDPRNPLTARVMVNRVWRYHMGRGIVDSANDFTFVGARPTHPQLLDWLASTFIEKGWSIKALHRLIVNSATYRQSSRGDVKGASVDADNALYGRWLPRRIEAEAVRDAMLSVSGELNLTMGGPSFQPFDVEVNNTSFYILKDKTGPEFARRTIYRMNVNSGKDPMLEALDCPDPSVKAPERRTTTTPLSALVLMNNPFVQRQAELFSERVLREAKGDQNTAIDLAGRYAFGRTLTSDERAKLAGLVRGHSMKDACWVLLNATEFLYVR